MSKVLYHLIPGPSAWFAVIVALPAALSLHESWDLLFSLATGRWILDHGFPSCDPFSLTADVAWFPHSWGFCVLAELFVRALGGSGPAVLMGLVLAAQVLLVGRIIAGARATGLVWLGLMLLVLWAQAYTFGTERAYQLGHLCFALGIWLVLLWKSGRSFAPWLFLPLVAIWANLHGSWIVGPALLFASALGAVIDAGRLQRRHLLAMAAAAVAYLAAAASPGGLEACVYPLKLLLGVQDRQIAEWHAWSMGNGAGLALLALSLIAAWALARSARRGWAFLLPALGLVLASVRHERFVPMAAISLAVAAADALTTGASLESSAPLGRALRWLDAWIDRWRAVAAGGIWPFAAVIATGIAALCAPVELADRLSPQYFPLKSLRALCALPPGRVLNIYRYGGAVSALCGPGHKVFIDGRNDPFPQSVHDDYRRLAMLEPGWREALERYDPDYLLWSRQPYGSGLLEILQSEGGFRELTGDALGVLWMRVREHTGGAKPSEPFTAY